MFTYGTTQSTGSRARISLAALALAAGTIGIGTVTAAPADAAGTGSVSGCIANFRQGGGAAQLLVVPRPGAGPSFIYRQGGATNSSGCYSFPGLPANGAVYQAKVFGPCNANGFRLTGLYYTQGGVTPNPLAQGQDQRQDTYLTTWGKC